MCHTVLVLEDQLTTQNIIAASIGAHPKFKLLGMLDNVSAAINWLEKSYPDVLLIDLKLKDGNAIDVINYCNNREVSPLILILSASDDPQTVEDCIYAGAHGYILKDQGLYSIASSIEELVLGGSPFSPMIARQMLTTYGNQVNADSGPGHTNILTEREISVLQLIEVGKTYEETALALGISISTVQFNIKNIYRKLAVNSRGRAIYVAKKRRLI